MAMTLTDGRGELYQWDTGRTLTVDDATVTQVHFQNRAYGRTIDVDVNNSVAIIPDEILQKPGDLRVYAFSGTAESGFTKVERVFNIMRRNKPNDYMYTPTEQKSLEGLQKQIGDLSDLKTDAKTDIVAAINETATAGQTLGLTGATVGQVPAVKAVDGNGAPTAWEAVELPIGAYTVNLTMGDDGSITADKTFAEIKAASDDGKVVAAKFADAIVPLCSISDSDAIFEVTQAISVKVVTVRFTCTSDNVWSMSENGFRAHTLGITGASAGQVPIVKSVDENGVPNGWGAGDLPSGESGWKLLKELTLESGTYTIVLTEDTVGNAISCMEIFAALYIPETFTGSKFLVGAFYPNAVPGMISIPFDAGKRHYATFYVTPMGGIAAVSTSTNAYSVPTTGVASFAVTPGGNSISSNTVFVRPDVLSGIRFSGDWEGNHSYPAGTKVLLYGR